VTRFQRPCIMDVKVGRRVWDDYADSNKIDKEKRKYPLQEVIGFRVTGMRVSGWGLRVRSCLALSGSELVKCCPISPLFLYFAIA